MSFSRLDGTRPQRSFTDRVAYAIGRPPRRAIDYYFRNARVIREAATQRFTADPGSIHHFEYLEPAAASLGFEGKAVFSMNDDEAAFMSSHRQIRRELTGRPLTSSEKREIAPSVPRR